MPKTVEVRFDDATYSLLEFRAQKEHRSVASFVEHATVTYLTEGSVVSDDEMQEILNDAELVAALKRARVDIAKENYRIVE